MKLFPNFQAVNGMLVRFTVEILCHLEKNKFFNDTGSWNFKHIVNVFKIRGYNAIKDTIPLIANFLFE